MGDRRRELRAVVGAELALADGALAAGDLLRCGDCLTRAALHLHRTRHTVADGDVFEAGTQIMHASLERWVPALLAHAGNVRDDEARWDLYRRAHRAILTVVGGCAVLVVADDPESLEGFAAVRDYCAPLLEGTALAIGAALA